MKKLLFILIVFFVGCKASAPDVKEYPKNMTPFEIKLQFSFDQCLYYQQYSDIDMRCFEIFNSNEKYKIILNYFYLKENDKLPELYRKTGSDKMNFDDLFKLIK